MLVSGPVTKASVVADFIAQVQQPVRTAITASSRWGIENRPWAAYTGAGHGLFGSIFVEADATIAWPGYENSAVSGSQATTNAFFIMHGFALRLTRFRRGTAYFLNNTNNVSFGTQLTAYAANNIVWFDPPTMPAPGAPVTAADVNNFLTSLRASVNSIRASAPAADFVACHSNCHTSCHGSRGRR